MKSVPGTKICIDILMTRKAVLITVREENNHINGFKDQHSIRFDRFMLI